MVAMRRAVAAGLIAMLVSAVVTATRPGFAEVVSTVFVVVLVLSGLVPTVSLGWRVRAAVVARRRFRALAVEPAAAVEPAPTLAELRRSA